MIKVALTGGLACGKSTVGQMFVKRGAHLVQADAIAHELMSPGQPVYNEVVRRFGREIVQPDGTIDRAALARLAFGGGRVEALNSIVHPAVIAQQEAWMEQMGKDDPDSVAIVEAALIFEAGLAKHFDKVITVTCRPEQKRERFAGRITERGSAEYAAALAEADRRIAAQIPDEEKARQSHYVIDNSGSLEETEAQVERVWRELCP